MLAISLINWYFGVLTIFIEGGLFEI